MMQQGSIIAGNKEAWKAHQYKKEGDKEVKALHNILAGQLEQFGTVKSFHDSSCSIATGTLACPHLVAYEPRGSPASR